MFSWKRLTNLAPPFGWGSHHATATDWSSADESVRVDEFASFGLLVCVIPDKARFFALLRALALGHCTLRCGPR